MPIALNYPVQVDDCVLQPAVEDVLDEDVLEEPQSEIGPHLLLHTVHHIRMITIHNALLDLPHEVLVQTLDHALTSIELQIQLIEAFRYSMYRHIDFFTVLDILQSFR